MHVMIRKAWIPMILLLAGRHEKLWTTIEQNQPCRISQVATSLRFDTHPALDFLLGKGKSGIQKSFRSTQKGQDQYLVMSPRQSRELASSAGEDSGHAKDDTGPSDRAQPIIAWSFVLPIISVSFLSCFLRKHGLSCCSDESVLDDAIPFEIVVRCKTGACDGTNWTATCPQTNGTSRWEDIELQSVSHSKAGDLQREDPVEGLSMLDTSDWTSHEQSTPTKNTVPPLSHHQEPNFDYSHFDP